MMKLVTRPNGMEYSHRAVISDKGETIEVDLDGLYEDPETGELYLRVFKEKVELRLPIPPG